MKDEDLKAQISDIIEGEIQNGINDYLEAQESKEDSGVGFVKGEDEAKELNVKVYQDQVDKLIKEYKRIKKAEIVEKPTKRLIKKTTAKPTIGNKTK